MRCKFNSSDPLACIQQFCIYVCLFVCLSICFGFFFSECLGPKEKWQHSRQLLGELKQDMSNVLPPGNVHEYLVPWTEKG